MIAENNIFLDLEVENYEDLFRKMNEFFLKRNYVNEGYLDAILEREKKYPTGLNFGAYSVAIPHTDHKYIISQNIVFVRLKEYIKFAEMGNGENEFDVKIVFMLLIKKGDDQIETLLKLMKILGESEVYDFLIKSNSEKEIYEYLNRKFISK